MLNYKPKETSREQTFEEYKTDLNEDYGLGGAYKDAYTEDGKSPNDGLATRREPERVESGLQAYSFSLKPDPSKIIQVRSNLKPLPLDKDRQQSFDVAIFEQSEFHPNGEIYIADSGEQIHSVALTERVCEKLTDKVLIAV